MKKRNSCMVGLLLLIIFSSVTCSSNNSMTTERDIKKNAYLEGENVKGLKETELVGKIKNHATKINLAASDAVLDKSNWELVAKEKPGISVNVEKTLGALLNAKEGTKVNLIVEKTMPPVTSENLNNNIVEIGKFTTTLLDKKLSRVNNIELSSDWINNEKIAPGQEFSFNQTLGKRTKEKGYEKAPIIIKTKKGPKKGSGVGGGICQLSSTLYNAALMAGMEITERHSHSKGVGYVPLGQDAAVSYGSVDFKFKNTRKFPVMIKVYLTNEQLTVTLLENRNVKKIA